MTNRHHSICDLHVHSTCSDGTHTPEELISLARRAGIEAVALCDHNTIAGLARFESAACGTDTIAVPGVEVTAEFAGKEVHLLGLFIPRHARDAVADFLREIDRRKQASNRILIRALADAGYDIDLPSVLETAGEATPNRVHVAHVLMTRGYVSSINEAFHTLLRDGGPYYRPPARLDVLDVIGFFRSIRAIPVLAHPLLTLTRDEVCRLLDMGRTRGLVGVETVYPLYSEEETVFMTEAAARFGLLPSGGSDFHGANKPDIALGRGHGNIAVPMEFYEQLKELSTP